MNDPTHRLSSSPLPKVLNVGGGHADIGMPTHYDTWQRLLLDIDPAGMPDVLCDARTLETQPAGQFDAVYCSHNLEHYYRHDVARVLRGFMHVLRDDGFAEIRVPDLRSVMRQAVANDLDVDDVLYQSGSGPISVGDVLYGYAIQIERSGNDFYAHKTGFTAKSLAQVLSTAGFRQVFIAEKPALFEISALAFKREPNVRQRELLGL